jgi:tetratricopeptide (TPR) repeat protein
MSRRFIPFGLRRGCGRKSKFTIPLKPRFISRLYAASPLLEGLVRSTRLAFSLAAVLTAAAAQADGRIPSDCTDVAPTSVLPRAVAACTDAIESGGLHGDDLAEAHRRRGVALARARMGEDALSDFDAALAIKPAWPAALSGKGRVLADRSRYDEAAVSFEAALRADPDFGPAHSGLGLVFNHNGDNERALAEYGRAFELNPKDWHALANRGLMRYLLGRPLEALEDFDAVLAADPEELGIIHTRFTDDWKVDFEAATQVRRAMVLYEVGRLDAAIEANRSILSRFPDASFAAEDLSELLATRGKQADALDVLSRAAERSPDDWRLPMQMARLLARGKDGQSARAILAKLQPPKTVEDGRVSFFQRRSRVWRTLGDYDAAIEDVGRGAALDQKYLASVATEMRRRGYLMDLPGVSPKEQFMNGLQACMRDFECAFFD